MKLSIFYGGERNDMRAQEVAKSVMRISNVTQTEMAEKLGKSGASTISMILSARAMKLEHLLAILNECGYELVARSKDGLRPEFIIGDDHGGMSYSPISRQKMRDMIREVVREELSRKNSADGPEDCKTGNVMDIDEENSHMWDKYENLEQDLPGDG